MTSYYDSYSPTSDVTFSSETSDEESIRTQDGGSKKECGPGKILREGYRRKGYQRKGYTRRDGTYVQPVYVSAAKVPPTCVPDVGAPGKGPKTLPPLGKEISLSQYGYSVHASGAKRREALRKASEDHSTLKVLRRLNLIRNYQAIPKNKEIFDGDVEYMKKLYSKIRRSPGGVLEQNLSRARPHVQLGGVKSTSSEEPLTDLGSFSETSEDVDQQGGAFKFETRTHKEEVCDPSGKCETKIKESHYVDGKELSFYTLTAKDADAVLSLDLEYLDSDQTKEKVLRKLQEHQGFLVGIKVGDRLEGYCQYEPVDQNNVKIVWFSANKGYGTILYIFLEKLFLKKGYRRIIIVVSLEDSFNVRRLNFWYQQGYTTYQIREKEKKIDMEKLL